MPSGLLSVSNPHLWSQGGDLGSGLHSGQSVTISILEGPQRRGGHAPVFQIRKQDPREVVAGQELNLLPCPELTGFCLQRFSSVERARVPHAHWVRARAWEAVGLCSGEETDLLPPGRGRTCPQSPPTALVFPGGWCLGGRGRQPSAGEGWHRAEVRLCLQTDPGQTLALPYQPSPGPRALHPLVPPFPSV